MCSVLFATSNWLDSHQYLALWLEGIALLAIFIWDRWDSHRQHQETLKQMKIMESHAIAAKDAAEAAKSSVEVIISKERARLGIEEVELKFLTIPTDQQRKIRTAFGNAGGDAVVQFKVACYGSTPAFILEGYCDVSITHSTGLQPDRKPNVPMSLPSVINLSTQGIERDTPVFESIKEATSSAADKYRCFIHFQAVIRWRDVFDKKWEINSRHVWVVTWTVTQDADGGFFSWSEYTQENEERAT